MKPVVIIGGGINPLGGLKIDLRGKDVWSFNTGAKRVPITATFQMHVPPYAYVDWYMDWIKSIDVPIYMRERHDDIPTSVEYPWEDAFALTGNVTQGLSQPEELKFFTSSVSYALALAILQGREEIEIHGVELNGKEEYEKQRECYAFWVGFAAGRGIKLIIRCGDSIFKKPLYGEILE